MAQRSFQVAVDEWVRATEQRMLAVFRTSAQYVIDDIVDRTPVVFGFLKASVDVNTNGPLPMSRDRPEGVESFEVPSYDLAILGAELGDTIYATFTANYGAHVEYGANGRTGRGMVRLAAQAWPSHVGRAVAEAKQRVG